MVVAACALAVAANAGAAERRTAPALTAKADKLTQAAMRVLEKDPAQARALMERAAASGEPDALSNLATLMAQGVGKPADPEGARRLLEQAVARGSNAGKLALAQMLVAGDAADQRRAAALLREVADDPRIGPATYYLLGRMALFGVGMDQDVSGGARLLDASLRWDPKNADALYLVGRGYQTGWGGHERNAKTAASYFRQSADLGDMRAERAYGMALLEGRGVAKDPEAAAQAFRRAATGGDRLGMIHLAVMLALGEAGTRKDQTEARDWYLKAAKLGAARAMGSLGAMLIIGQGGAADLPTGWAYLEMATEAGDPLAPRAATLFPKPEPALRPAIDKVKADWRAANPPLTPD